MTFSISVSGSSSKPHNAAVQAGVEALVAELEKVPGLTASVGGYTWDNGGQENRVDLTRTISVPDEQAAEE